MDELCWHVLLLIDMPSQHVAEIRPLRFAMVTTFYPPFNFGGDGIYVQRLAHALKLRGHHVEVIHDTSAFRTMTGTDPEASEFDDGIRIHRLRSRLPGVAALQVQQTGSPIVHRRKIARILADRFDVIHFHNISLIGGPGIWALGNGVKLHTAHEHWLVCASHILWRDNREVCDERHCIRCVLNYRRPPQIWRAGGYLKKFAQHVDTFLMLSQSAADNHRRFGFDLPVTVVPSFLPDAEVLSDHRDANIATRPYFLFVGRLENIKGLQDVIPHFNESLAADLFIAGSGDYEAELRQLSKDQPSVKFLGYTQMSQLRLLYRGARALLTPSRCFEVFPLVVLEAFREATPIVARNLGPYPEIITASGGGLLFSDEATLRTALHKLTDEPQTAHEMGRRAKEVYDQTWTEAIALKAYFRAIRSAAMNSGRAQLAQNCESFL